MLDASAQGALAGAVALVLATLFGLYKLININGGQARARMAAESRAPRAKRD